MRNKFKILASTMLLFLAYSSSQAQLSLGGGLGFGTEIGGIGLTVKANYPFTEQWEGSGSFSYFFSQGRTGGLNVGFWEFNADAHYILNSTGNITFYPLAGLEVAGVTFDYNGNFPNTFLGGTRTEIGLNIGAGGTLALSESLSGYGELKYTLSGFSQLVFNLGVLLQLGAK